MQVDSIPKEQFMGLKFHIWKGAEGLFGQINSDVSLKAWNICHLCHIIVGNVEKKSGDHNCTKDHTLRNTV
jgi:hypothetical protein